jgi:catechol 2,3-dioxygenase-like lactoylglutathione lyase family enzyme
VQRGIGSIQRILFWELNVSDVDRTVAFYEQLTSFRAEGPAVEHDREIDGRPGRARSVLLANTNRAAPLPTIRLTQWLDPRPVGRPHASPGAIGFFRVVVHVTDLDETRRRAEALGAHPFAPTTGDAFRFVLGSTGSRSYRAFAVHDPDGIVVEFLESPSPKLSTVAQGTGHFEANRDLYIEVLGLELTDTVETAQPVPNIYTPSGGTVSFRGGFFQAHDDAHGYLDVLEHTDPAVRDAPYPSGNHVGVIACALEVDDPGRVGEAIEQDLGPTLGRRRMLPFSDREGVRYLLVASPLDPA